MRSKTTSTRRSRLEKLKEKNKIYKNRQKSGVIISAPDNTLFMIILTIAIFGLAAVFSAGAPEGMEDYNNPAYYVLKQSIFMFLGFLILFFFSKKDYKKFEQWAFPFALGTIFLIGLTYIPGLGTTSNGSTRWLSFIPFLQVQPSEFAKISVILLIASSISKAKTLLDQKLLRSLLLVGVMVILILKQPNLSVSMVVAAITGFMMYVGGTSETLFVSGATVMGFLAYHNIMHNAYQLKRITGWLDPWKDVHETGYNLIQSWFAIGSGGVFGVGFGNSKQKLFYLPFRHTDFIFSVICEELGFIGGVILIGLYLALIHRGFTIASRCPDSFGRLVAFGISVAIGLQALINMAVATGVMPVTGVTLPLVSYGGTSILVTMAMLGILLNISRKRIQKLPINGETNEQD
ncbi:MAG: putative lipid II flippase FtsW [bacterium]